MQFDFDFLDEKNYNGIPVKTFLNFELYLDNCGFLFLVIENNMKN